MELLPDAYFIICLLSSNGKDSGYFIKWVISIQFPSNDDPDSVPRQWFNSTNWSRLKIRHPLRSSSCTKRNCEWTNFWHLPSVQPSLQKDIWCCRLFRSKCHDVNLIAADTESQNYPENSPSTKTFQLKANRPLSTHYEGGGGSMMLSTLNKFGHVWGNRALGWEDGGLGAVTIEVWTSQHWRVVVSCRCNTSHLVHVSPLIIEFSLLRHCRLFEYFHGCTLRS